MSSTDELCLTHVCLAVLYLDVRSIAICCNASEAAWHVHLAARQSQHAESASCVPCRHIASIHVYVVGVAVQTQTSRRQAVTIPLCEDAHHGSRVDKHVQSAEWICQGLIWTGTRRLLGRGRLVASSSAISRCRTDLPLLGESDTGCQGRQRMRKLRGCGCPQGPTPHPHSAKMDVYTTFLTDSENAGPLGHPHPYPPG